MRPIVRRRVELLLAPTVIFFAVVGLVLISPYSHLIPGLKQTCGLREWTGYPCLACGGTRSVQALGSGKLLAALKFNPLVFLSVCAVAVWFVITLWRSLRMSEKRQPAGAIRKLRARWWLLGLVVLAAMNWWYLVKYLPA